jgi:hypothetical protein
MGICLDCFRRVNKQDAQETSNILTPDAVTFKFISIMKKRNEYFLFRRHDDKPPLKLLIVVLNKTKNVVLMKMN